MWADRQGKKRLTKWREHTEVFDAAEKIVDEKMSYHAQALGGENNLFLVDMNKERPYFVRMKEKKLQWSSCNMKFKCENWQKINAIL